MAKPSMILPMSILPPSPPIPPPSEQQQQQTDDINVTGSSSNNNNIRFSSPGRSQLQLKWSSWKRRLFSAAPPPSDSIYSTTDLSETTTTEMDDRMGFSTARKCGIVGGRLNGGSNTTATLTGPCGGGAGSYWRGAMVDEDAITTVSNATKTVIDENDDIIVLDNSAPYELWGFGSNQSEKGGAGGGAFSNTVPAKSIASGGVGAGGGGSAHHVDLARKSWWESTVWPLLLHFFNPRYVTDEEENLFQRERWYQNKTTALLSACFLVTTWALSFATPRPWSEWNEIESYFIGPCFTLPIIPAILFDFPRNRPILWQVMLMLAAWLWPTGNIIDMRICDYYGLVPNCANRDFQGTLYYASAIPTIALFALGQSRLFAVIAISCWLLLTFSAIVPVRVPYLRNTTNIALFHCFIIFTHWRIEINQRKMWTLRAELKTQFRAKQKAQVEEKKANDSKTRFTSYILHELRNPLNTALLAVQNLEGSSSKRLEDSELEHSTLRSSFSMMSQVLNDVLDFTRMERGGFATVERPFNFDTVMSSIFLPLQLDTSARGLSLETNLDPRIADAADIIMGDEIRLRQIISNLTSNACKFTESGGKVSVVTSLVYVTPAALSYIQPAAAATLLDVTGGCESMSSSESTQCSARLSVNRLQQHESRTGGYKDGSTDHHQQQQLQQRRVVVIRIEVSDSGVGIKKRDLVDHRLFSAYVQTEIGRSQGGKGTGLGLSLVRQIVLLSGGRLGVRSQFGVGSSFWVELAFPICADHPVKGDGSGTTLARSGSTSDTARASPVASLPSIVKIDEAAGSIESITTPPLPFLPSTLPACIPYPPASLPITSSTKLTGSRPPSRARPHLPASSKSFGPSATTYSSSHSPILAASHPLSLSSSAPVTICDGIEGHGRDNSLDDADGSSSSSGINIPLRVLIVDDDSLTRRLMSRMMERLNCETATAENGAIALEMILRKDEESTLGSNYDLIFLDNQMPVKSGLEVAQTLRALGRDDLLCGVTANALLSDQELYLRCGANFVLTKPVAERDLKRMLQMAKERRARLAQ